MPTINIIGTVGAGKTTLAHKLQSLTQLPVGYEANSEELDLKTRNLLAKYYNDPTKYALEKNLFFLEQRAKTLSENQKHQAYISDRFLYDDFLMALLNMRNQQMNEQEWEEYTSAFNKVEDTFYNKKTPSDDVLIFIKPGFENALSQIKLRGRKEEQISNNPELKDYYQDMYNLYTEIFDNWNNTPKIIVNRVEDIDMVKLIKNIKIKQPAFSDILP